MDIICRLVIFRGISIGINDCSDSDHGSNCVKPSTEDAEPKRNSKLSGISSCRSSLLWRNIKTFASFHGTWEMSPVMLMGCFVDSDWVIFFPRDFIFTPVFKCRCGGCGHGLISALQKEFIGSRTALLGSECALSPFPNEFWHLEQWRKHGLSVSTDQSLIKTVSLLCSNNFTLYKRSKHWSNIY